MLHSVSYSSENLIFIYEICMKIDSGKYNKGFVRVPILFKNKIFSCSSCDMVGKGNNFYINRAKLLSRDPFIFCKHCARIDSSRVMPLPCNCCGGSIQKDQEYVITISTNDQNKGKVAAVCVSCAQQGKYSQNYMYCFCCSQYTEKLDSGSKLCDVCYAKIYKCTSCFKYHFKSERDKIQYMFYNQNKSAEIAAVCHSTKVRAKGLEELIAKDSSLLKKKQLLEVV